MNDCLRFLFLLLAVTGMAGVGLAEDVPSIRAEWKMPPQCDPFGPVRINDLKEELRQTGYRLVIAIHPEKRDPASGEYAPRDLYLINADGTGLRQLTHTADREERVPRTSPDGSMFTYNYGDILVDVKTLKESEHWGG